MAEAAPNPMDDLDAFFSAAASDDPDALRQAAESVAGIKPTPKPKGQTKTIARTRGTTKVRPKRTTAVVHMSGEGTPNAASIPSSGTLPEDLEGKFIAVEPEASGKAATADQPFVLIPAHVHFFLPWWAWVTIGVGLAILMLGVLLTPGITLDRLTARLGDGNQANVQSAMAQLVIKGDERTVSRLYEMAASREAEMSTRLRAVDTLGLIEMADADRALLRLELATGTDVQVREAAIAARRQREAAKSRNRNR